MTYNGADLEARKNLAATIDTPVEVLRRLSADPEAEVRCLVASNPNTPTDILQKLGEEFPESVTANPVFDLLALENPDSKFIKLLLARSSTTPEEVLASFTKTNRHEDEDILCAVAKNISTPVYILEELAVWESIDDGSYPKGHRVHHCVAANPKTPPLLREKLANHQYSYVRQAVAQSLNTTPTILDNLAKRKYQDVEVLKIIVKNPNISACTLEYLAGEEDEEIRCAVLEHPNVSNTAIDIVRFVEEKPGTPSYIIEFFVNDSRLHLRQLVADHPFTPAHILEKLATERDTYIRKCLICNPNTPSAALEILIKDLVNNSKTIWNLFGNPEQIFKNLREHSNITISGLLELANIDYYGILNFVPKLNHLHSSIFIELAQNKLVSLNSIDAFAKNPDTPSEALKILFAKFRATRNYSIRDLCQIMTHPNMPINLLKKIAFDEIDSLRAAVAKNPTTPVQVLYKLMNDNSFHVLSAVAENKNTPFYLLIQLSQNQNNYIRGGVARNINAPTNLLEKLACDNEFWVRRHVAENISSPIHILEYLAQDEVDFVRRGVAENVKTSVSILEMLAHNPKEIVREKVAKHPNSTPNILEYLSNCSEENVQMGVAENLNTSYDTLLRLAANGSDRVRKVLIDRNGISKNLIARICEATLEKIKINDAECSFESYTTLSSIGRHCNTPTHILEYLAYSLPDDIVNKLTLGNFYGLQKAVASNANTPVSILEKLAVEEFIETRKAARKTLKTKSYIHEKLSR